MCFFSRTAYENVKLRDLVLTRDTSLNPMALEIEGALWIRSHSESTSIVMARHVPIVYHYADRKLVWFPPSSNSKILMQGILRHNVNYVMVIKHRKPYYMPDDDYCFDKLLAEHAEAFRLVFQDSDLRIMEVELPRA